MFAVGSCMGSFLCCQARRMHLRTSTKKKKNLGTRSVCIRCGYQLKWYDNIPVLSWLMLGGKCRKCGKKIGLAELISELGMGCAFAMLATTINIAIATPLEWGVFLATIVLTVILGGLAIYDGLYGELPVVGLVIAIVCGVIVLVLKEWMLISEIPFSIDRNIWGPVGAVAVLGGLYFMLYVVARGRWVGDGDWLLGVAVGLTLMSPWLGLVTLCLTNVLACIAIVPVLKKTGKRRIYLGPFMVAAWVIVTTLADVLMSIV